MADLDSEEILALADIIKMLNDDDALELLNSQALAFNKNGKKSDRRRIDFIMLSIRNGDIATRVFARDIAHVSLSAVQ